MVLVDAEIVFQISIIAFQHYIIDLINTLPVFLPRSKKCCVIILWSTSTKEYIAIGYENYSNTHISILHNVKKSANLKLP